MVETDDVPVSRVVSECYSFIAGPDGISRSQLARLIAERCQPEHMAAHRRRLACHVAEVDGQVAGFIAFSAGRIEELFVHPKHHRSGIATALFRKAESECGGSTLTVGTTGYGLPFYQAMGMRVTGKRLVTIGPLAGRQVTELACGAVRPGDRH
jgi:GNAT superfamily N-acetyltransferase